MPSHIDRPDDSTRVGLPSAPEPDGVTQPDAEATRPSIPQETVPQAQKRSVSRAAWFALITGAVALIFLLVFVVQNNLPATFTFWAWSFTLPLGVAMLFAAIAGALVTAMVGSARMIVLGRSVRSLEHDRDQNR